MRISNIDSMIINFFVKLREPIARLSLFVVFFWFGILKVLERSPASAVMEDLFERTIPIMEFKLFLTAFGTFECLIGILFLIRGMERVVMPLLLIHMITTFGPLVLLSHDMWSGFLTPTLDGQYIIKNLAIISVAISIAASLKPINSKS